MDISVIKLLIPDQGVHIFYSFKPLCFQTHCYRATLETVIATKRPDLRQTSLKTVAHAHRLSFADYAAKATSQLAVGFDREADFDSEGK